jgi:hypothetical protein
MGVYSCNDITLSLDANFLRGLLPAFPAFISSNSTLSPRVAAVHVDTSAAAFLGGAIEAGRRLSRLDVMSPNQLR